MKLDHIAIVASTLEAGVSWVEQALGVPLQPGGQHALFGTHNMLLSLGPDVYLEVIAVDPAATPPGRARWFDLDRFTGTPRIGNWIVNTEDISSDVARLGEQIGRTVLLARADLRWTMAVPDSGVLPFDNIHPALIEWGGRHPAPTLIDQGVRLRALHVSHPQAQGLQALIDLGDDCVVYETGAPGLRAVFDTPSGRCTLG